ncbi:AAA family ATPase [Clostridium gasigenes]|uniref:AAA family ATPase n=1 Tax=Clostridium gasigenes TaxID=94869 RepID=UPI001C0DE68C|nr:AAA family ATPase [Clostridium gasigenes]MBU3133366.1 AAA family ATPase [Clostridium gasigenes]
MKLLSLELNNFRNIEFKKVEFVDKENNVRNFTAIIGDNGVGKTSILEAITKGFTPIIRSVAKKAIEKCDLNDNDIKQGEGWTAIYINAALGNETYSWYNKRRINSKVDYIERVNKILDIKGIKSKYEECHMEERLPLVLYYGINRVVSDIPKRGHIKNFKTEDALKNCFDNVNYFRDFYEWFKTEEDMELRETKDNSEYLNIKLNSVRSAIERMIPGYTNLRIMLKPSRMIITNKSGEHLRVEQLSGGYKAILSMVSDIAKRLSIANPNSKNPLEEEGIILIDEIDLHLHPKWQKTIAGDLQRTFPNCQFIVTTHSPFIIQSLNKEEVINIEKEHIDEIGSFEGWSIEEIQEYEMGVQTKTEKYKHIIEEFSDAIDDDEREIARGLYEQLVKMIHPGSCEKRIIDVDMAGL